MPPVDRFCTFGRQFTAESGPDIEVARGIAQERRRAFIGRVRELQRRT